MDLTQVSCNKVTSIDVHLYVLLSTGNILQDPVLVDALIEDYRYLQNKTKPQAFILFLIDLRKRLKKHMKTLEDFGLHIEPVTRLPYVLENQSELQQERNKYDVTAQTILYNDLTLRFPPNTEQQEAYDVIFTAIETADNTDTQQFICLHGAAGTGKSIVGQTVAAKLRQQGYLVSICASTTLAATNYENADTAHALFGYEVREDDDEFDGETEQECKLDTAPYAERMELLQQTRLIIWDEAFGNHTTLLEAAVRALAANKKLVWLIIGDTRQTLPVIQYGTPDDIIGATITSSFLWARFTVLFLQENKRLTSQFYGNRSRKCCGATDVCSGYFGNWGRSL